MAAGALTMDDLLNFNLQESAGENNKENTHFAPISDIHHGLPLPDFGEEDLEWLSNKDAFPFLEDSYLDNILLETPSIILNHHSPVSVLNSINISNTNNIKNGNNNGCGPRATVPVRYPMKPRSNQRKRRTTFSTHQQFVLLCQQNAARKKQQQQQPVRKCTHCQVEETPQWRAGPMGPKTLCNACGVRYKSGRLVPEYRPANSPTFSSSLHSNSHRKVVEMRKQKQLGGVEISEPCAHTRVA